MDPALAALIGEGLKISIAVYLAAQQAAGQSEEEAKASLKDIIEKIIAFDPNTIKDV